MSISEAELRTLLDERDIVAVALLYCRALDTKDFELLRGVFLLEATADLSSGTELIGFDAIKGRIETALDRFDETQHLVGNHEVTIDGDTATHRCYLQAQHVKRGADASNYLIGGRYEDHLVRTEVGWRIAHRTLAVMWTDPVFPSRAN